MYTRESLIELLDKEFLDDKFVFEPIEHKYTYEDTPYTSVTTFIQKFHKPFEKDEMSLRTASKRGISQEEVLKEWDEKNDYSKKIGHFIHLWIENYYNKIHTELPTIPDYVNRINKFNTIYYKYLKDLEWIRSEQKIFSKKRYLAGTIDTLFLYKGSVIILDWKTNIKLTSDIDTTYNKLFFPFQNHWQNLVNEYSIQQSIYAYILQEVGIDVKAMYLCYIPEDGEARIIKCKDFRKELDIYFNKMDMNMNKDFSNIDDIGLEI